MTESGHFGISKKTITQENYRHQAKKILNREDYEHKALVAFMHMLLFLAIIAVIGGSFFGVWDHKSPSLLIFVIVIYICFAGFRHYFMEFREARAGLRGVILESQA